MNLQVVKNAVGALEKLLSEARGALQQVEAEVYAGPFDVEGGAYEHPKYALEGYLEKIYSALLVVLEASEMPGARGSLIEAWAGFTSGGDGLRHTDDDDEFMHCESPALTFVERLIQGLRMTVSEEISSEQAWTLSRLEAMLRDTPGLVHRRAKMPSGEIELQGIMHDYLSACFADFRPDPKIGGALKSFKPDCGIASVSAAIAFKFVDTEEKKGVAFSGIAEDSAAYKGSKDWTRFYAVVYQTQPFMLESHLRSDIQRIGAAMWLPIVVNAGSKERSPIKALTKAGRKKASP